MDRIVTNAGSFFFFSYITVFVIGGLATYLEGRGYADLVTPLIFYAFGVVGAVLLVASFFSGSKDRQGERPTFGVFALFWLFAAVFVVLASALYLRLELAFPEALPSVPEWILFGFRDAAFVLVFEVGWGMFFGSRRGWLTRESDPWPLGFLFRRASSPVSANDEIEPDMTGEE